MGFKFDLRHPKVQQSVLEVVFPLAGYFFWDWSLLIIVIFYLIDWLASQVMYTFRLNKVKTQFNESFGWVLPVSIVVFIVLFLATNLFLYSSFDSIYELIKDSNLNNEIVTFSKDELWYLFPLIILSYYMMDKMLFYVPKYFTNYSVRPYLYKNIVSNVIATVIIFSGVLIYLVIEVSDIFTIVLIVLIKLFFDVVIKKYGIKMD